MSIASLFLVAMDKLLSLGLPTNQVPVVITFPTRAGGKGSVKTLLRQTVSDDSRWTVPWGYHYGHTKQYVFTNLHVTKIILDQLDAGGGVTMRLAQKGEEPQLVNGIGATEEESWESFSQRVWAITGKWPEDLPTREVNRDEWLDEDDLTQISSSHGALLGDEDTGDEYQFIKFREKFHPAGVRVRR